jgi:hypothetical protein
MGGYAGMWQMQQDTLLGIVATSAFVSALPQLHASLQVNAQARHRSCRLSFAFVYPDKHGRNVMRQVWYDTRGGNSI